MCIEIPKVLSSPGPYLEHMGWINVSPFLAAEDNLETLATIMCMQESKFIFQSVARCYVSNVVKENGEPCKVSLKWR